MARHATHGWILTALGMLLLAVVIYVDFHVLSWTLSYMLGADDEVLSLPRFHIASVVFVLVQIGLSVIVGLLLLRQRLAIGGLATVPSRERRLAVVLGSILMVAFAVIHGALAYLVWLFDTDSAAWGFEPQPLQLPLGIEIAAGNIGLSGLAVLLPGLIFGLVLMVLLGVARAVGNVPGPGTGPVRTVERS